MRLTSTVTEDSTLTEALRALTESPGTGLPVLGADRTRLTGWITHESVLAALDPRLGGPPPAESAGPA